MLTITVGPNGSGKSLWGMHQLERALLRDRRTIVTSLAVDLPALNEYMQRKYPKESIDVCNRVVVIGKELQRTFWRVRGGKFDEYYGRQPLVRGHFGDSSWREPDGGILYILDEIQTTFGARDWQQRGGEFVEYQSQHRKLSDDVICITPASSLVEKQFRLLCGECCVLRNMYQVRMGMWKAPRKIVYKLYENCPPVPGEESFHKGDIYIDAKALAGCYRTQDGLGVVGSQADKGKEAKGIPWWVIIPIGAVGAFVLWYASSSLLHWGAGKGTQLASIGGKVPAPAIKTPAVVSAPAVQVSAVPVVQVAPSLPVHFKDPEVKSARELTKVYGWCKANGRTFFDTEVGLIEGQKMEDRGLTLVLDGQPFRRGLREKTGK